MPTWHASRFSCVAGQRRERFLLELRPGIAKRHGAVEDRRAWIREHSVGDEVAQALELEPLLGPYLEQRGLERHAAHDLQRLGVQLLGEVVTGERHGEKAIVEAHRSATRVL